MLSGRSIDLCFTLRLERLFLDGTSSTISGCGIGLLSSYVRDMRRLAYTFTSVSERTKVERIVSGHLKETGITRQRSTSFSSRTPAASVHRFRIISEWLVMTVTTL